MGNLDTIFLLAQMFTNRVSDKHGAMAPTGPAYANRHEVYAFFFVLRKKKVDKGVDVIQELRRSLMGIHVLNDGRIRSGVGFQMRHKIRIRQEPDVKDQIRIDGNTVLEPKAHERYEQM